MNTNNLTKITDLDFSEVSTTHEQRVMAEHNQKNGYEIYYEGPYKCGYSGKMYGYIWCIQEGVRNGVKKINGLGYTVR